MCFSVKNWYNIRRVFLNILGILLQDGMIQQIVIDLNFGMMEILNQFLNQKTSNHMKFLKTVHGGTRNFIKYSTIGFQIQNLYKIRNREIIDFFNEQSPKSLIVSKLEDPHKWEELGGFMEIQIPKDFKIHSNKSLKQN